MSATGACILGLAGPELTPQERDLFRHVRPWGFILFGRNVETPAQLRRLTAALRAAAGHEAPVLIDQEGGRVARLGAPHWREWMAPLDQIAAVGPRDAARAMKLRYRIIAAELHELGIDVDCAPIADVAEGTTHPFLKNRCYGFDPDTVAAIGRAVAEGLRAGGVLPVLKHIPGHGRAVVDSHRDVPFTAAEAGALRARDFAAFRALRDLPMAMTAHVVYAAFDGARVATRSPRMITLVREEIGFDGLLMSDDIGMGALSGPVELRTRAALDAGCDLVLHCNGELEEMADVAEAAGALDGAAERRASAALACRCPPEPVDIAALEAELAGLVDGTGR